MKFGLRKKNKVFNLGGYSWGTGNLDLGRKNKVFNFGGVFWET